MWLFRVVNGLRLALVIGGGALAGLVTGAVPVLTAVAVLVVCIGWAAWNWERLREYNRSDRY